MQAVWWGFMVSVFNSWGGCFLHPGLHPAFDTSSLPTVCAEMGSKSGQSSPKRWLMVKDVNGL